MHILLNRKIKKTRASTVILAGILTCMECAVLLMGIRYFKVYYPQFFTSYLNPITISEVCSILEIKPNDIRCQSDSKIFAYQFYPELRNHYERKTPRYIVDQDIGKYLIGCKSHDTSSDGGYLECYYDFTSDNVYKVRILYAHMYSLDRNIEPDQRLEEGIWKICAPAVMETPDDWLIAFEVCY